MARKVKVQSAPPSNGDVPQSFSTESVPPVPTFDASRFSPPPAPISVAPQQLLRLDFGCGPNPREGFEGVDQYPFDGKVRHVLNLVIPIRGRRADLKRDEWVEYVMAYEKWPWADCSVEEAHTAHFVEHLTAVERVHFANELHRILVPGGKCTLIVPHWGSCRAYGDPSHQWPPVSEFWFYYLKREWRMGDPNPRACPCAGKNNVCPQCGGRGYFTVPPNAPHTDASVWPLGFKCDFDVTWGYAAHPAWTTRSNEAQQFAFQWYKESIQDIFATLTKLGK